MPQMLSGYKTYVVMAIGIVVNGAYAMDLIDAEMVKGMNSLLVFLGLGAFRSAINKKK